MKFAKHSSVQEFVDSLEEYKDTVNELRMTMKDAIPGVQELIKWSTLTYEKDGKTIGAIMVHKDHINLQLWRGAELEDPKCILEGSGKGMRHVRIVEPDDACRAELKSVLKRAGKLG
jgi:hypothetical protein